MSYVSLNSRLYLLVEGWATFRTRSVRPPQSRQYGLWSGWYQTTRAASTRPALIGPFIRRSERGGRSLDRGREFCGLRTGQVSPNELADRRSNRPIVTYIPTGLSMHGTYSCVPLAASPSARLRTLMNDDGSSGPTWGFRVCFWSCLGSVSSI